MTAFNTKILSGQSLSAVVTNPIGGFRCKAIQMPAAWDAANLTFFASVDGITYQEIYDGQGNEYTVNASASRYIILDPAVFDQIQWLKIQSGTTGAPVNQTADRIITLNMG